MDWGSAVRISIVASAGGGAASLIAAQFTKNPLAWLLAGTAGSVVAIKYFGK